MEDVLALKSQEIGVEEAPPVTTPARAPLGQTPGGATNAEGREDADGTALQTNVPAIKTAPSSSAPSKTPGFCPRSEMIAASPLYLPKTNSSSLAKNSLATAIVPGMHGVDVVPSSDDCPEHAPNSEMSLEETRNGKRTTDYHFESLLPSALPRVVSSGNSEQPRPFQKESSIPADRVSDKNGSGSDAVDENGNYQNRTGSELPRLVPNFAPTQSAPHSSSKLVRPNAPMVLVIFRSDSPPPEKLRRGLESAASTVAGGARIDFMDISATIYSDGSISDELGLGGVVRMRAEDVARRRVLEARLSRLLADADKGVDQDIIFLEILVRLS